MDLLVRITMAFGFLCLGGWRTYLDHGFTHCHFGLDAIYILYH